jgi:hypothetical protein
VEKWEQADKNGPGNDRQHHELLRAFEWKGAWGRRGSALSGVSPGATPRIGSVDSQFPGDGVRRRTSGQSVNMLERARSGDVETVMEE